MCGHNLPAVQPRCCAGWQQLWSPDLSPARPRIVWKSFPRNPRYRCSHPTASHVRLHTKYHITYNQITHFTDLKKGKRSVVRTTDHKIKDNILNNSLHVFFFWDPHLFFHSWRHHSRSCRGLPDCSSWSECTWPPLHWWRGRRMSLWWLSETGNENHALYVMLK